MQSESGALCLIRSKASVAIYQEVIEHFIPHSADQLHAETDFIVQLDVTPVPTVKMINIWLKDCDVTVQTYASLVS